MTAVPVIRSQTPGRVRFEVPGLAGAGTGNALIATGLDALDGVTEVTVNTVTGRILILFDAAKRSVETLSDAVGVLATQALDAADAGSEEGTDEPAPRGPEDMVATVALGCVAGALILGASAHAVLVTACIGTGATVATAVITERRAKPEPGQTGRFSFMRDVVSRLSKHGLKITVAGALSIASVLFGIARFLFIGLALNVVVKAAMTQQFGAAVMKSVIGLGLLSMVTTAVQGILMYWAQQFTIDVAQDVQHSLRLDVFERIQHVPMTYFDADTRARIESVIGEEINQIEHVFFAVQEAIQILVAAFALVAMFFFFLSPFWALLILAFVPLTIGGSFLLHRKSRPALDEALEAVGRLRSRLSESLSGLPTIKSFTAEAEEFLRIRSESDAFRDKKKGAARYSSAYRPVLEIVVMGATVVSLVGSASAVSGGLSIGMFFLLVMTTRQLLWPLTQFGRIFEMAQGGWQGWHRAYDLIGTDIEEPNHGDALPVETVTGEIVFDRVAFTYPGRGSTLDDIEIRIEPGQTVGLVGPTGCGKSTLVSLLMRLNLPEGGQVLLDGHDISAVKMRDLRSAIAYTAQDPFFFNGSIRDNVTLGKTGFSDEDLAHAAHVACADEMIAAQPGTWDYVIGERGEHLSGGERQRLAIARAVLKNAPVLLLDEATSNVDNRTQDVIRRRLTKARKGKTTVIIAHQLSAIADADMTYVLRSGRVLEAGSHDELLAKGGLYARLWSLQVASEDQNGAAAG